MTRWPGSFPAFVDRAEGDRFIDVDGNDCVDLCLGDTGSVAAAVVNDGLDAFFQPWSLNRGILLAPFHNMALFSPFHTQNDVDRHTEVFGAAVDALIC